MNHPIAPRSPFSPLPLALRTALLASLFTAVTLRAVDFYWDANGTAGAGGAGTWNRTNNYWRQNSPDATSLTSWGNGAHSSDTAIFSGSAGQVTVSGGTRNNNRLYVDNLRFAVADYVLSGGTLTLNGSDRFSTVTVDLGSATIASALVNNASTAYGLTKEGGGTLILGGTSTYTGATTVSAGTLQIGNGGTTGTLGTGAATVAGGATLAVNRSDAYTIGTVISGSGGFAQNGTGTTTLTQVNTYTGATVINAGTLRFGGTGDVDVINRASALVVNTGGTVDLGAYTEDTNVLTLNGGTITGGAAAALGVITTPANAGAGLDIRSGTADVILRNPLYPQSTPPPGDAPAIGLTKSTNGVAILTKANTYTGPTAITGGTLVVNGSTAQGSSVTVGYNAAAGTGGVLAGTGTVNGTVAVSGSGTLKGTLSPGAVALNGAASIGVLHTGGETWSDGSAMDWQVNSTGGLAGTNFDQLQINGGLNLANLGTNGFTLKVIGLNGAAPGDIANFVGTWNPNQMTTYSWTLLTTTSGISGFDAGKFQIDLSHFTNSYDPGHGRFFVGLSGANNLVLTYESIPEPATYGACLGAMTIGLVGIRNWRRRRAVAA